MSDLPVGYNLQDHISTSVAFSSVLQLTLPTAFRLALTLGLLSIPSVPTGSLVWGNLLDATRQAAALTLYKSGDYSNSQLTYLNDATGCECSRSSSSSLHQELILADPSVSDIMADGASFASAATAALDANVAAITSYQTLPANVAAGTKLQYQITNGWLSTDSGCLEIIQSEFSGTDGVAIQVALQHPYSRGTIMINSTECVLLFSARFSPSSDCRLPAPPFQRLLQARHRPWLLRHVVRHGDHDKRHRFCAQGASSSPPPRCARR